MSLAPAGHRAGSVALVLCAGALFGTIGTARVLGPAASSWSVGAVRMLAASALLVAVALVLGAAADLRAALGERATWVAGVGQAAFQVTFLAAVELTGVAVGTLVAIGSAPIVSGLLTRHTSKIWALATALGVAGLALLVLGGAGDGGALHPVGIALALGGGVSYATYIVATKHVVRRGHAAVPTAAAAFTVAAIVLTPGLLGDLGWLGTPEGAAMAGYLALVATVLSYLLFTAGLRGLPAATANTLGLTEPLVATMLGVFLLSERLPVQGWLGALLVLAGLAMLARSTGGRAGESSA
jgi:DME family drug/metabolite transporter